MPEIFQEGKEKSSAKKPNILSRAWSRTKEELGNLGRSTINAGKNVGARFSNWQAERQYAAEQRAAERQAKINELLAERSEAALRADANEAHRSRQVTLGQNYRQRGGSRKTRKINKNRKNIRTRKINKRIKTNRNRITRRTSRKH